ncbi:MAG: glutamate 5-kinase [Actinomycetota bacterium]|nr:glutamate 5-kinase [Actinomycetota bacterium]
MRRAAPHGSPVVLKVGSSALTLASGGLDPEGVAQVAEQVADLWDHHHPTVLVSSGAVAAGFPALGLDRRPTQLSALQVAAAVGQGRLMERYTNELSRRGRVAGQVLLTKDVLADRQQYLHARRALGLMLSLEVVPVVNENDTVAVEELRWGDNDRLAALVAHLVGAGMLVMLTDAPGLLSGDPRVDGRAELFAEVRHTDEVLDRLARAGPGPLGSGGMATKVAAARIAAWSGIPTVIAQARAPGTAVRAVAGEEVGSWVEPGPSRLPSRKLWIAFGQPSEGRLLVDGGAVNALLNRGSSLLPAGVRGVEGQFQAGAAVEVWGPGETLVAKGLTRVSASRLEPLLGRRTSEIELSGWGGEVIHRDDLVVLR